MNIFVVEMRDSRDGSYFDFECEANSSDEAESIANDEHAHATAVNVRVA